MAAGAFQEQHWIQRCFFRFTLIYSHSSGFTQILKKKIKKMRKQTHLFVNSETTGQD